MNPTILEPGCKMTKEPELWGGGERSWSLSGGFYVEKVVFRPLKAFHGPGWGEKGGRQKWLGEKGIRRDGHSRILNCLKIGSFWPLQRGGGEASGKRKEKNPRWKGSNGYHPLPGSKEKGP